MLIDQDVQVINISQNTDRLKGFAASHGNRNAVAYLTRQASLAGKGLARIISSREAAGKKILSYALSWEIITIHIITGMKRRLMVIGGKGHSGKRSRACLAGKEKLGCAGVL